MTTKECTKENLYNEHDDAPDIQWCHIDAIEVGEQRDGYPGGDIQRFRCPNCGLEWEQELPQ